MEITKSTMLYGSESKTVKKHLQGSKVTVQWLYIGTIRNSFY